MRTLFTIICCTMIMGVMTAQKRIKPPKSKTNIESVDSFVDAAFNIYNSVFDFHYGITNGTDAYDAMDESGEEGTEENLSDEADYEVVEQEIEKDEFKIMEDNIALLMKTVPDILEEIDSHSVSKQLKATLNLNKGIKALKQSGEFVKKTLVGE